MKIYKIGLIAITFIYILTVNAQNQPITSSVSKKTIGYSNFSNPSRILLPKNYHVWVLGRTVLSRPAPGPYPGFKEKILPTYNFYKGHPGCYLACYSNQAVKNVFPVNDTTFVKGQIRVPGHYQGKICYPSGSARKDLSENVYLKNLCRKYIKSCRAGKCWANGNTGAWIGI